MSVPWLEHLLTARVSLLLLQTQRHASTGRVTQNIVPTDRLIWIKQGSLAYRSQETTTELSAGDFWLVPALTRRSWQVSSKAGCTMVWVEFVVLNATTPAPAAWVKRAPVELRQAMTTLPELAQSSSTTSKLLAEIQLKWLLAQVIEQGAMRTKTDANPTAVVDRGLSELLLFMRNQLHDPDLLAKLPDHASLSPGRLRARFSAALGQSPGRYLQALRMQHARYLLLTTDMSVKQIAGKVGFDDPLYFSRRYRNFWGKPATQDRAPSP